jgi:hypothetical protein
LVGKKLTGTASGLLGTNGTNVTYEIYGGTGTTTVDGTLLGTLDEARTTTEVCSGTGTADDGNVDDCNQIVGT